MAKDTHKFEVFSVWSDEIDNRLDPRFYLPQFTEFEKLLANRKDTKTLGDITEYVGSGATPLAGGDAYISKEEGGIPFIRVTNLKDGQIDLTDTLCIKPEIHNGMLKRTQLKAGDILLSMAGTIGLVAIVQDDIGEANINQALARIVLKKGYSNKYIGAVLASSIGMRQTDRLARPSVQSNINLDEIRSIKLPIPSEKVQKEVVEKIQTAYNEKRKKEEEIKKILASIDDFVLGELGMDIAGEHERERERVSEAAPETYIIWSDEIERRIDPNFYRPYYRQLLRAIETKNNARLGELVELSNETWDQKNVFADTFPYIEISAIDLKTGDIAEIEQIPIADAPSRAKMVVRQGDIIVSTTRPNRGAITTIEKEQDGSIASTGFAVLREMRTDKISKDFLFVMLRSILSLKQMEQRTTGGNYPAITPEDLKQIRIALPDKTKQEKITSGVQSSYSKMRTLRAQAAEVLAGAQKQVEQLILAKP